MITSANSEVTPNAKSVIWAGIVIFALATTIWYLLPHDRPAPTPPAPTPPAQIIPQKSAETSGRAARARILAAKRAHLKRAIEVEGSDVRRTEFVSQLQQRFATKGRTVSVDAVGPERRTLRLMWAPGRTDREHMVRLRTAEPFALELRGQGFTSLMMQVGERIIWQKNL